MTPDEKVRFESMEKQVLTLKTELAQTEMVLATLIAVLIAIFAIFIVARLVSG